MTQLTGGRLSRLERKGAVILDDTYNANPESMTAALETIAAIPVSGTKIAVLGKMGELGSHAGSGYNQVGSKAATSVQTLICVGEEAFAMASAAIESGLTDVHTASDNAEASKILSERLRSGDLVLIKGSRSARMEQIIQQLD
jgi:UDP-N-acetylmuramoyl-tripeptide--D-alanyl-D-alanine ligase